MSSDGMKKLAPRAKEKSPPPLHREMQHVVGSKEGWFEDEDLPGTFASLIDSAEIVAYLQLAGHHLNRENLRKTLGETVDIDLDPQLKGRFDIPGRDCLRYEVVKVFGDDLNIKTPGRAPYEATGAAVAFRPEHAPNQLVVVFRAVRLSEHPGFHTDVRMLTSQRFTKQPWQAEGERMSAGIAEYLITCESLFEWLQQGEQDALPGASFYSYTEVSFVGHSLGASLAQAAAYRASRQANARSAVDALRVVSFGGTQWIDAQGARSYDAALGSRALHLSTFLYQRIPSSVKSDALPEWWAILKLDFGGMRFPANGGAEAEGSGTPKVAGVIDPLVAAGCAPSCPLSIRAIESPQDVVEGAHRHPKDHDEIAALYESGPGLRRLVEWPFRKRNFTRLERWFHGAFDPEDPLWIDYVRLHRGRSYQLGLLNLVRERQKRRQTATVAAEPASAEAGVAAQQTAGESRMVLTTPHVEPTGEAPDATSLHAEQPPGKAEVDSVANAEGIIEPAPTPPPGGAGQLMRNAVAAVARPMSAVASTIGKVSKKTAVGMQKSVGKVSEVTSIGVQKTVNVVTFKGFRQQPISEDESPKASPAHSMQRTSSKRTLSDMVDASPNASPCHSMQCTSSKRTLSDMDMGCPTESPSSFTNVGVRTQTLGQGSELNSSTPPTREDGSVDMQIQSKLPKRPSVGTNLANVASEALCIETEDGRDTELFMF